MRPTGRYLRGLILCCLAVASARSATAADQVADAAERRDRPALERLLKQGADVNAPQPDGATALQWATHWDDVDMVERLLRAGANVNAVNDHRVTALALACENRSL